MLLLAVVFAGFVYVGHQVGINLSGKHGADPARAHFIYLVSCVVTYCMVSQLPALINGSFITSLRDTPKIYAFWVGYGVLGALASYVAACGFAKFPVETSLITSIAPFTGVPLMLALGSRIKPSDFDNFTLETHKVVFLTGAVVCVLGYFYWPVVARVASNLYVGRVAFAAS